MGMFRWILGGLVGAAAGVAVWVAVGYYTEYEVGWIAWGVGLAVGVGVRYAAYLGDEEESTTQGVVAAALAIGAILAAKYILFSIFTGDIDRVLDQVSFTDEDMVASMADDIAKKTEDSGQKVAWPPGMNYDDAERKADYPPAIWKQAETQWNGLSDQEKETKKEVKEQEVRALVAMVSDAISPSFSSFFTPWDLLWFGLATITAFRVGVGSYGEE